MGKVHLWGTIGGWEDLWGYYECRPEKWDSGPGEGVWRLVGSGFGWERRLDGG